MGSESLINPESTQHLKRKYLINVIGEHCGKQKWQDYYTISNVVQGRERRHLVGEYRAIKSDIIPPSLLYNKHVMAQETKTDQLGNSIRFAPVTRAGRQ